MGSLDEVATRGKLISLPRLANWLSKISFLAGSRHHPVDAALFIDGKLIRV
jgi:hypothetical protein